MNLIKSLAKSLLIIAVIVGGYAGIRYVLFKPGFTADELARQANAHLSLPMPLYGNVTLRSVTGAGDKLVFTYSLDHFDKPTLDADIVATLDKEDGPSMCEMIKELSRSAALDQELVLGRDYLNAQGSKIHSTEIPLARCV